MCLLYNLQARNLNYHPLCGLHVAVGFQTRVLDSVGKFHISSSANDRKPLQTWLKFCLVVWWCQ